MPKQIPVYLFVGQLESGKTKFIQETMEDPNFDSGDKTLLLVCEEGEIEYDPSKFAFGGVHVAQIEDKSELTAENLTALEKKSGCGRVIIEYNGMWLIQELYDALPDNWLVYQSLATADGTTIKTYAGDSAMRSLLLDKLRGSELLVVNRAEAVNDDESRQLIHKLVRQASRRCDIAYEFKDGSVAYDDIPDPLPFDVDAPVIEIPEEFFGIWYMDCMDDPKKYDGKTVKYLAQVCQRDTVVGLEGVIIFKFVQQNGVICHVPTVLVEHVLLGHVLHPAHARGGSDALPYRLDGGIVGFGVHIDHHFVLLAQIVHHAVHIDFRQRGKGIQGHTDAQGGDAGNGHGPVLAQVAHAAHHKETERRRLHHTSDTSISSSFGSTGG